MEGKPALTIKDHFWFSQISPYSSFAYAFGVVVGVYCLLMMMIVGVGVWTQP